MKRSNNTIPWTLAYWPEGLRLYLQDGVKWRDKNDNFVLEQVLRLGDLDNVHRLLNYECPVDVNIFIQASNALDQYSGQDGREIMKSLATLLARQRSLSASDLAKPGLMSASQSFYTSEYDDLYKFSSLTSGVAECLWTAGFRDIAVETNGRTPLWEHVIHLKKNIKESIDLISWFAEKGAKLNSVHPKFQAAPAHLLIRRLADAALRLRNQFQGIELWLEFPFIMDIILLPTRDECSCHCSPGGCTPLICVIQEAVRNSERSLWSDYADIVTQESMEHNQFLDEALDSIYKIAEGNKQSRPWIAGSTLRGLTFSALNLTHTCCYKVGSYANGYNLEDFLTQEDIYDIHFSESRDIKFLDSLVDEFERKWEQYKSTFSGFIKEVWKPRMNGRVSKSSEMNDIEELKGIIEAGVVLHPFGPEESADEAIF